MMKQLTYHQVRIRCERFMAGFETLLRNIGQIHCEVIKKEGMLIRTRFIASRSK